MYMEKQTQVNTQNQSNNLRHSEPLSNTQEIELAVRQAKRATRDAAREEIRTSTTFSCFLALAGIDATPALAR